MFTPFGLSRSKAPMLVMNSITAALLSVLWRRAFVNDRPRQEVPNLSRSISEPKSKERLLHRHEGLTAIGKQSERSFCFRDCSQRARDKRNAWDRIGVVSLSISFYSGKRRNLAARPHGLWYLSATITQFGCVLVFVVTPYKIHRGLLVPSFWRAIKNHERADQLLPTTGIA